LWLGTPSIKRTLQSSITQSLSKMRLWCSKNSDEYKQSYCIKARNHKLLDFLHLSRNRYLDLHSRASTVFEALWKNVYLFLERCKKSKYGCVLLDADRLFIFLFILILRTWVYFFSHFLVI